VAEYNQAMTPKIYVLVGMIASGKSTYCRTASKKGAVIMNDDAIVNMVHADDYTLYDKKLKILYKTLENTVISVGVSLGRNVIVDRGLNISRKARKRWVALADSFDVECHAIVFPKDAAEVHAKRRFEKDNRGHSYDYWLNVATEHDKQYETPDWTEGFFEVHTINFGWITSGFSV